MLKSVIPILMVFSFAYAGHVSAQERSPGVMEYGVTAYGIYSMATNGSEKEGRIYVLNDAETYPGWSGSGTGVGLGINAMWKGIVGIDMQLHYIERTLEGKFDDPAGYQLEYKDISPKFFVPILLKAAWPTKIVTPTVSIGMAWSKSNGSIETGNIRGNIPEVSQMSSVGNEQWVTRFGGSLEAKLPLNKHDVRISLSVMANYNGDVAAAVEGEGEDSICIQGSSVGQDMNQNVCILEPFDNLVWQTDVMLGLGYHFR